MPQFVIEVNADTCRSSSSVSGGQTERARARERARERERELEREKEERERGREGESEREDYALGPSKSVHRCTPSASQVVVHLDTRHVERSADVPPATQAWFVSPGLGCSVALH